MEKLKELIGEYDEADSDDGEVSGLGDASGEEAEEMETCVSRGSEEEAAGEDEGEATPPATGKTKPTKKAAKKAPGNSKRKSESEAGNAEKSIEEEDMQDKRNRCVHRHAGIDRRGRSRSFHRR